MQFTTVDTSKATSYNLKEIIDEKQNAIEMDGGINMNAEMRYRQRKFLVTIQIVMAVIGLLLGIGDLFNAPTFGDIVANFLILPIALAGLVRFGVRAYQIASIKFGRKVYDEAGNSLTVARRGLGVVVGFACPFVLAGVFSSFMYQLPVLAVILALMLLAVAVFLFVLDVHFVKAEK